MRSKQSDTIPSDNVVSFIPLSNPFSREAEQSVIGGLMLSSAALPKISSILKVDDFYQSEHKILFSAVCEVIVSGAIADPVTVAECLEKRGNLDKIGGIAYLSLLVSNTPSAANIVSYANIVKDRALDREIEALWNERDLGKLDQLAVLCEAKTFLHSHGEILVDTGELLDMDIPKKEPALVPWLFTRDIWMIHAWRGVGKSQIALEIAFSIATGTDMFDGRWFAPEPRRVAYFDGEMGAEELQTRLRRMVDTHGVKPDKGFLRIYTPDLFKTRINLVTVEGQAFANRFIGDAEADIVVMDNLSTLAGGIDENSAKEFQPVQDWLINCRAEGKTVGVINHSNKTGAQRGTSKHEDVLNASINLRKPDDDDVSFKGARFEVHFEKTRGLTQQPILVSLPENTVPELGLVAGQWIVEDIGEPLPKPNQSEQYILDLIKDGHNTTDALAKQMDGKSRTSIKQALYRMKKKGFITQSNDDVITLV